METRPEDEALGRLTPRERDVLALLRLGLTNQEIAERLSISADGAKYHVSEIISKLGVRDRYEAASWPERRPWWTAALTPAVLLWRNAVARVPINLSSVAAAISVGLLATVLGGIGLMAFLLVRGGNDPASDPRLTNSRTQPTVAQVDDQSDHNPLLDDDRTHLSICVDGAGGYSVTDADIAAVRETLEDAVASVSSVPAEYSERNVVEGCPPPPPALTDETIAVNNRLDSLIVPVDVPSEHRVFVYLLARDVYETSFGSELYAIAASEIFCGGGDVCLEMTHGLYVSASVSSDVLREGLVSALILLPYTQGPAPIFDWEACERGEQPHPDFGCERYEDWKQEQQELEAAP